MKGSSRTTHEILLFESSELAHLNLLMLHLLHFLLYKKQLHYIAEIYLRPSKK